MAISNPSKIPSVTIFLNYRNQRHNLRPTSASFLSNAGGIISVYVMADGNNSVAQSFVQETISSKMNLARKILGENLETEDNVKVNTEKKIE